MKVLNSIITWLFKQRIGQVEDMIKHPHVTQNKIFNQLINTAKNTNFGKEFEYSSIKTLDSFKERVPIYTYETLFPYIEKIMQGEQNVLWPTEIKWFAKSSGTTSGRSKFIPVSKEALDDCHFKGAKDTMAIYCHNNPDSKVFAGKSLIMGGSHQVNQLNDSSKYGDVSAVIMQNMPFWSQFIRTPELKIALLDEWEEKLELMAVQTLSQNVTNMAGVPTWTLVLIKRLLELSGKSDLSEIWPNLELYVHGGVNFQPYKQQFQQLISSPNMRYYQAYNASEGIFGMQIENHVDDMLLMLDYGVYYEFIPVTNASDERPQTLSLNEVEIGKPYAIVISTNSGLWRYKVGDLIEFTSVNPYKIKVVGRTKSFMNAFGEEVIVDNADMAIDMACKRTNAILKEYTAAPVYFSSGNQGTHEWIIEFAKQPTDIDEFTNILDSSLQEINSDYEAKRHKSIALSIPTVHAAPKGTFSTWLKQKGKLGGQNKVPRLNNDREMIDEVLALMN